jgi:Hg(II)-responsive transcriptional regulator
MKPSRSGRSTPSDRPLSTSAVARAAGVGVETLRFYERRGVLAEPPRSAAGYRQYGRDAIARLRFIKRAQELGFSLREIRELLALRVRKGDCSAVKRRAEGKLQEIDRKIADLQRISAVLRDVTEACVESNPIGECPILRSFESEPANHPRPDRRG